MGIRLATVADRPAWDEMALHRCGGRLLGCWGWGELKRRQGWELIRLVAEGSAGELTGLFHIQLRRGTGGVGFAYAPRSPLVADLASAEGAGTALALIKEASRLARRRRCLVLKLDPEWPEADPATASVLGRARLRDSWYDVQHRKTYVVDLEGGADAVFARLKESTRRHIRAGRKGGLELEVTTDAAAARAFWPLLAETGERNGFIPRHAQYYVELIEEVGGSCPAAVILGRSEGEVLAGMIAVCAGPRLIYLYGGNRTSQPRLQAPYSVQWRAMEWGLENGCSLYDMWGVPNHEDPTVPGYGYYEFKTRFNGRVERHVRCQDVRLWPWLGPLPRALERLALRGRPLLS